jgi:hypothetical protein
MRKMLLATCSAVLLAALAGIGTGPGKAHADYGTGAQYQIEMSWNCSNATCGPIIGSGAGVWLWIELNQNGTGDYHGSDCLHGYGALSDSGNVTWTDSGGKLTVNGFSVAGGLFTSFTFPDTYGHYTLSLAYLTAGSFPLPGLAQLQVAP